MTDPKKDPMDALINFILADDSPVEAEDQDDVDAFNNAVTAAEQKLARARFERAKAGVASSQISTGKVLDLESARRLLARARSGDETARVTLAARFGDGSMDDDMDVILEGLAELEADQRDED